MRNKQVIYLTQAAIIAALYVILTMISNVMGLSSGVIQIRFSEALTILPYFTGAAIPGLFIGCLVSNIITGAIVWDVIFGSVATLLGALLTYGLRKHKFLLTLPPVLMNMIIVPLVLTYGYGLESGILWNGMDMSLVFYAITVGIGEVISVCIMGSLLLNILNKYRYIIFKHNERKPGGKNGKTD